MKLPETDDWGVELSTEKLSELQALFDMPSWYAQAVAAPFSDRSPDLARMFYDGLSYDESGAPVYGGYVTPEHGEEWDWVKANVSVRINPNIDAHTHRYVTTGLYENKFGISRHEFDTVIDLLKNARNLNFIGLHFHIGSQITDVRDVYSLECRRAAEIVDYFESRGLKVDSIDLGGGLGADYDDPDGNPVPDFETWFSTVDSCLRRRPDQKVSLEPGRSLVAQCGTLVTRVLFVKNGETKAFLIMDAGMNDLIRPALYGAYHKIENLTAAFEGREDGIQQYDVVGPVCESSDVWGSGRDLPFSVRGDLMALRSAGAYGSVMSSRYNLRDIAPAVFSDEL